MNRLALAVVASASVTATATTTACSKPQPAPAFDPSASLPIASDDVELAVGAFRVGATVTHPTRAGRYPAIVVIAGSGPTDRDWNSPLLKGKNGSGKLLGDALARRGAVVVRFDKPGTGKTTTASLADVTADTYRDEALAAIAAVRARPDVDPARVVVAGHSEGGLHAIRVALADRHVAGLVLLSTAARSLADLLYAQIDKQMREAQARGAVAAPLADAELASLRRALDDLAAGKDVDPAKASTLPALQQLVASLVSPLNAKVVRSMIGLDPTKLVAQVTVPVLVVNGKKDIQVDAELDAAALDRALRAAHRDVTLVVAPDADHVLKHEPRTLDQIRADLEATQNAYNAPDRTLDGAIVDAVATWLARVTSSRS